MRTRLALTAALLVPLLASAQAQVDQPHAAVPILPDWSIGAGFGFFVSGPSLAALGTPGLAGLLGGTGGLGISSVTQPQVTMLVERRLSEQLFLTFQGAASYGASQDDLDAELRTHFLSLQGAFGVRRLFNPRGVVEVSWFGNAGVGYTNAESRFYASTFDSSTGMYTATTLQIFRSHTFTVGAATGLTLERQLIEGLALRLSSSILGVSYGLGASTATIGDSNTDRQNHQVDVGLRFSPSIELRYAF